MPRTVAEVQQALVAASAAGRRVIPTGGGTRHRPEPRSDVQPLSTTALTGIVEHVPAELTATVRAGTTVETFAATLAEAGQWWPQADRRPGSTVGGVVATAAGSRHRRGAGAVRDSLLEVVLVTGDGRLVKGGGPTVKSVAGYDIPRLATGSHGTLGVIVQVTVKLTPRPAAEGWFVAEGPPAERRALAERLTNEVFRLGALLATPGRLWAFRIGPPADVVAPTGMSATSAPPNEPRDATMVHIGVPPATIPELVARMETLGVDYLAEYGTGVCDVALPDPSRQSEITGLAVAMGGHATVTTDLGAPLVVAPPRNPALVAIDERLHRVFDPQGILRRSDPRESAR